MSQEDVVFGYAHRGDIRSLEYAISKGFFPNTPDSKGRTILHWAVDSGNVKFVSEILGKYSLDITAKDNEGYSSYDYAKHCGYMEIVTLLLDRAKGDATSLSSKSCVSPLKSARKTDPNSELAPATQQPTDNRSHHWDMNDATELPPLPAGLEVAHLRNLSESDYTELLRLLADADNASDTTHSSQDGGSSLFPEFGFRPLASDLKWKLSGSEPGTASFCLGLYRQSDSGEKRMVGFLAATEIGIKISNKETKSDQILNVYEAHTLVLQKAYRGKRLTTLLSGYLVRIMEQSGIHKPICIFTTVVPLPTTPLTLCKYYHYPINLRKLADTKYWRIPSTLFDLLRQYPTSSTNTDSAKWSKLTEQDVPAATALLNNHLSKYTVSQHFTEKQFHFMFLNGSMKVHVRRDDRETPTDMFSYFVMETHSHKNVALRAAFLFYSVAKTITQEQLIFEMINVAKSESDCDVLLVLDNFDNFEFIDSLGFEHAFDSQLFFYFFKNPPIPPNLLGLNML